MRPNPDGPVPPASNQVNLEDAAKKLAEDPEWITVATLGTGQRSSVNGVSWGLLALPIGLYAICAYLVLLGHIRLVDALPPGSGVALALAVLTLLVYGATRLFRRSVFSGILTSITVTSLLLTAGGGLAALRPAQIAQARAYEQSGEWSLAIKEYESAGERGSSAQDIPRVYDEWGEALLQQGQYSAALTRFTTVTASYANSGPAAARARRDMLDTYNSWLQSDVAGLPYADAITFFEAYRQTDECDSTCQSQLDALEPQATFLYGEALFDQGNYGDAYSEFSYIQLHFSSSEYAHAAYLDAAKAEYAQGKSLLAIKSADNCSQALSLYQSLVQNYASTPQAASAKAAMRAPQTVTGVFTRYPTNPTPRVYLSRKAYAPLTGNAPPGSFYFSNDYQTTMNAQTGAFTFRSVTPGVYALTTFRYTATGDWTEWFYNGSSVLSYQVVPLCSTDLGTFDDSGQK